MGDTPDFTAKTVLLIDSSQALAGAADYERALDKTVEASNAAAAATDNLGTKIDTTTKTLVQTRRELNANEAALRTQSTAIGGTAGASIEAAKQLSQLQKATAGVSDAMHAGTISVQQGNAELALLSGRQDLVAKTAARLQSGFIDGATAMALLNGSSKEGVVAAEALSTAHGHVAGSSVKVREGLVLVHEFLSGNYKRAMGSATIEAQALFGANNLLALALNPLVLGVAAATAAFVAIALSSSRYRTEVAQLDIGLISTARGIGLTTDGLLNIAKATAAASDISQSEARKIVASVQQVGNLSAASLAFAAENGKAFGKIIGQDAAKGAEDLAKALASPVKSLEELDQKFHFLDPVLQQYIKDLVDSGQAERAQEVIRSHIAPQLAEITGKVKETTSGFHDLGHAASDAYDNLRKLAGDVSVSERLAAMAAQLTALRNATPEANAFAAGVRGGGLINLGAGGVAEAPQPQLTSRDLNDLQEGEIMRQNAAAREAETEAMRKQALEASAVADKYASQTVEMHKLQSEELLLSQAIAEFGSRSTDTIELLDEWTSGLAAVRQKLAELKTPLQTFIDQIKEQDASIKLQAQGFGKATAAQLELRLHQEAVTKGYIDQTGALLPEVKAVIDSAVADQRKLDGLVAMKPVLDEHVAALNKATESMKAFDDKVDLKGLLPGAALVKEYNDKLADLDTRITTITSDLTHFSGTAAEHTKITLDLAKATDERTRAESDGAKVLQTAADLNQKAHDTAFKRVEELEAEAEATAGGARSLALFNELKKEAVERSQVYTSVLEEQTKELGNVKDAQDAANAAADRAVAALRKAFDVQQLTADAAKVEHVWENTFKQAAQNLDNTIVRSLADAFDGKKLQSWGDTLKQILSQVAAEIVNIALIKPVIGSALLSFGLPQAAAAFGAGAGGAAGSGAAASGGGISASTLGNAFSLGQVLNGGNGFLGSASGASQFLLGTPSDLIQGPLLPGTSFAPTAGIIPGSSGGTLGGFSLGQIGTGLGGLAGIGGGIAALLGGRQNALGAASDVAQIGGGALALSSALGGPLLGLGDAAGPVGLGVAAAAAIIGALFGNSKPHNISGLDINSVGAGGGLSPLAIGNDNGANTDQLQQLLSGGAQPFLQSLSTRFGASFVGNNIGAFSHQTEGGSDFTTGFTGPVPGQSFAFDPNDKSGASLNDALTHLGLAMLQTANSISNADVEAARFNISLDDTAANIQKYLDFAANFRTTIDALNSGGGFDLSKSIAGAAQQNAAALQAQVKTFTDLTAQLFAGGPQIEQANAAIKTYLETLIGLSVPVDTALSPMEAAAQTLRANLTALTPLLDQFGISAADQARALAQGMAKLKQTETDNLQAADYSATGLDAINQVKTIIASEQINLRDAAATGADAALATKLAFDQAAGAMSSLNEDQLKALIGVIANTADATDVLAAASQRLTKVQSDAAAQAAADAQALASLNASVDQKLNQAQGRDYINQISAAMAEFKDNVSAGIDPTKAMSLKSAELANVISALTIPKLLDVIGTFGDIGGASDALATSASQVAQKAYADWMASIDKAGAAAVAASPAITEAAAAMQGMETAAQSMAGSLNASAASIKAAIEGFLTGSLTALSPRDQLAEAQRQFDKSPSQQTAQALLQLGQPFFGGATQNYSDLFHSTLSTLAQTGAAQAVAASVAPLIFGSQNGVDLGAASAAAAAANSSFLSGLPHFDKGGTVPGRIGAPTLAVVHGGEKVTPANDNGNSALAAAFRSLEAKFDVLIGATVNGSATIARAATRTPDIQSGRKGVAPAARR